MEARSMTARLNIIGPPGSGKTTTAIQMITQDMQRYGPENVAVVSFTKTAATEIQNRLADAAGIKNRTQPSLRKTFPKVGTLHSLAYRLLGVQQKQMANEHFQEFADYVRIAAPKKKYDKSPEFADAYWWIGDNLANEAEALLSSVAASRHQGISIEAAFDQLPVAKQLQTSSGRIASLAKQYMMWLRESDLMDFESLLEEGLKVPLGAKALYLDEAQDCSALQWCTVNAWAEHADFFTAA